MPPSRSRPEHPDPGRPPGARASCPRCRHCRHRHFPRRHRRRRCGRCCDRPTACAAAATPVRAPLAVAILRLPGRRVRFEPGPGLGLGHRGRGGRSRGGRSAVAGPWRGGLGGGGAGRDRAGAQEVLVQVAGLAARQHHQIVVGLRHPAERVDPLPLARLGHGLGTLDRQGAQAGIAADGLGGELGEELEPAVDVWSQIARGCGRGLAGRSAEPQLLLQVGRDAAGEPQGQQGQGTAHTRHQRSTPAAGHGTRHAAAILRQDGRRVKAMPAMGTFRAAMRLPSTNRPRPPAPPGKLHEHAQPLGHDPRRTGGGAARRRRSTRRRERSWPPTWPASPPSGPG